MAPQHQEAQGERGRHDEADWPPQPGPEDGGDDDGKWREAGGSGLLPVLAVRVDHVAVAHLAKA